MVKFSITELTKDNEEQYLDKVAELENIVLENMEKSGKVGQLFITGREDISEYAHSKENTVMLATTDGEVESATYITQGQQPFTYNDITKYFKYGKEYAQYVKASYTSEEEYKKDMLEIYEIKLKAFKYAKEKIMKENPQYKNNIIEYLKDELENNEFHEKSELRENFNKYMSEYIKKIGEEERYEKFYWITSDEIAKEFKKSIDINKTGNKEMQEYEIFKALEEEEYKLMLKKGNLIIHEKPEFDISKYYNANTSNTVEIDTYITRPNQRQMGIARIIIFEGIKKHISEYFKNPENKEIYFCSTLHRSNLSSKYVSEFFGLTDSLYVKRRQGRDREVHICKISRENIQEYLNDIQDKLIALYNYNPENKKISGQRQIEVLKEQLKYERAQYKRLNNVRHSEKNYTGIVNDMQSKANKIIQYKNKINEIKERENGGER